MIIIIGLVVLIASVIVGVAGVVANSGETHTLPQGFTVFDYHFAGSTALLFVGGIVLGAIGMFGLTLLLSGVWQQSRRSTAARRELRRSRREMAATRRDLAKAPAPASTPPASTAAPRERGWNRFIGKPSGPATT
ncbi:hypothetical protein [Nocardia sp. NPDC052566]|uniref:hypothetical protein n=1 Tax=Nocardia sp. NPDC052566 TaxID=3364330 RepID=UPI0037C98FCE